MMTVSEIERFTSLRQRVLDEIERQRKKGELGKMADGDMELIYRIKNDGFVQWFMTLHCYLIGPGRHYSWRGENLSAVLSAAEEDIDEWIVTEVTRDA